MTPEEKRWRDSEDQRWNEAIERSIQGAPPIPKYHTGRLLSDGTVMFTGWLATIGGVFPSTLATTGAPPPPDIDMSDIKYYGFLRRIVDSKMYCAVVPGEYADQVIPGQTFTVDWPGFKIGEYTQEEVDAALAEAEKKLLEVSAQS